ncbi:MAG: hypothetical protein ABR598_02280 [Candidatus Dormibacteria bacterium]
MAVSAEQTPGSERGSAWLKNYPPVVAALVGLLLAVVLLPSALNLPQANPTETAEYAPIPPQDKNAPPPNGGSLGSLGLGSSNSLAADAAPPPSTGADTSGGAEAGVGVNGGEVSGVPSQYRCVGRPPRQTEDPFSPPCVAQFTGDNFGNTYQGVTKDQVRVLFYIEGNGCYQRVVEETVPRPNAKYYDLEHPVGQDHPEDQAENAFLTVLRGYQKYFNEHYQTYKRYVHFYVYYGRAGTGPNGCPTSTERQADAADNFNTIHPFAVQNVSTANAVAYQNAMNGYGVLDFSSTSKGSSIGRPAATFAAHPGLTWSFAPTIEHQAELVSSYICKKMTAPNSVVTYAKSPENQPATNLKGKQRKWGLLYTSDPLYPELRYYKDQLVADASKCGIDLSTYQRTFPLATYDLDEKRTTIDYAVKNMNYFQSNGVTTLLWAGGTEDFDSRAAASLHYYPEWLLAGDRRIDGSTMATSADPSEAANFVTVSNATLVHARANEECYRAYSEASPSAAPGDNESFLACELYPDLREMFVGIQVAGPRLSPANVDKGYHAIPHVISTDPTVPTCFYDPGDYTCVKDGVAEHFDVTGVDENATAGGCYRMMENGKRYLAGGWPAGDPQAQINPNDICNTFAGG